MPRFFQLSALLRRQGITLGLIAFLTAIFVVQCIAGYEFTYRFSAIPVEIVSAWDGIRSGNSVTGAAEKISTLHGRVAAR